MQPNGPLPPEIYWRRRALVGGAALIAVLLLGWIVLSIGSDDETAAPAKDAAASETLDPAKPSASGEAPPPPAAPAPPPPAVPAGQCPDSSLAVKAEVEQANYSVGQQPAFRLVVTNVSTVACDRDLGSGLQQMIVYSLDGQNRLWSSVDCFPGGAEDIKTFQPGQQQAFRVEWSGSTSQPECAGERDQVAPGAYIAVAQVGAIRSVPEPFNITQ